MKPKRILNFESRKTGFNLARYYKKHDRLADHKRIRPLENRVLAEAGFFDEKPKLLEEDTDLVVLTSNIAFKFAGQTSEGDGLTLLEHARKRRHDEQAAAQALEPRLGGEDVCYWANDPDGKKRKAFNRMTVATLRYRVAEFDNDDRPVAKRPRIADGNDNESGCV